MWLTKRIRILLNKEGDEVENELYHHGILGMKWGVRRFQNTDGSLTNTGKKRYSAKDAMQIAKGVLDPKNGVIDEYRPNRQKPIGTIEEKRTKTKFDEYLRQNTKSMIRSDKEQPAPPHSKWKNEGKLPAGTIEENPLRKHKSVYMTEIDKSRLYEDGKKVVSNLLKKGG